jgi:hypothetical protein
MGAESEAHDAACVADSGADLKVAVAVAAERASLVQAMFGARRHDDDRTGRAPRNVCGDAAEQRRTSPA